MIESMKLLKTPLLTKIAPLTAFYLRQHFSNSQTLVLILICNGGTQPTPSKSDYIQYTQKWLEFGRYVRLDYNIRL